MDMTYRHGCLHIDYNEVGFTTRDVEAICKISSTKTASVDQTGEKGIGFKSVFRIADVVSVLSRNYLLVPVRHDEGSAWSPPSG